MSMEPTKRTVRTSRLVPIGEGHEEVETTTEEFEALSSIELQVNAKGAVQPTVKVYNADPTVAYEQAKALLARAKADGLVPPEAGR